MKILVISDLHTGEKATAKELCPYPGGALKNDKLISSFIEVVKKYQSNQGVIDFLVLPGDITHKSNLVEYQHGADFIKKITNELSIEQERVVFVPGNHDVDWSIFTGIPEEEKKLRVTHKYNTLKDDRHLFSKLTGVELLESPYFQKWEFPKVVFFGFNSSWHDDSIHDKHYGLIEIEQINALRSELEKTNLDKLKIFVVHHHLHQFDNPHPSWIDISIMQNAQSLINLLSEFSFHFVIHGHRHLPNFLSTSIASFNPINILCSGSYCCEVPAEIAGYVGNIFHIIEFDEYDSQLCKGRVLSYAYDLRKGWIESKPNHGIDYLNPFGARIDLKSLIKDCEKEVNKHFISSPFFEYSKLEELIKELKYLPLISKNNLVEQIQSLCSCKIGTIGDDQFFIKTS